MSSTKRDHAGNVSRMRPRVMRQGLPACSGASSTTIYDVDLAEEHGAIRAATGSASREQRVVSHGQRRHHLDAGQMGIPVVCRVGSCLPHAPARHGRSGLRQAAARSDAAGALPASERPDAGLRVELRRRQSAGACLGDAVHLPHSSRPRRAKATRRSSSGLSTSCCSTSPGGSTGRTATAGTSSKAAFSVWITSASSTAALRCPPAVTSNRRMAPRGWRFSARTCWRSPLELALHDPSYEDMADQVL